MPSRKLTFRCNRCGNKNHLRSNFCSQCGTRLRESRESRDEEVPNKLYADVAHPINQACRDSIQQRVVEEYVLELERAKLPGYVSRYDDAYESHDAGPIGGAGSVVPPPHLGAPRTHQVSAPAPSNDEPKSRRQ